MAAGDFAFPDRHPSQQPEEPELQDQAEEPGPIDASPAAVAELVDALEGHLGFVWRLQQLYRRPL